MFSGYLGGLLVFRLSIYKDQTDYIGHVTDTAEFSGRDNAQVKCKVT